MTETAVTLQPGFTTADAEYPSISLKDGTLDLNFVEFSGRSVSVCFRGAVAVNWRELDMVGPNGRNDEVYEIRKSSWVASHYNKGARDKTELLRHYRLCFNASGTLDIIASDMEFLQP